MVQRASGEQYRNAPIEEALVEFQFAPGREWDPTVPGKLHEHPAIKQAYPGTPRTQKILQAALQQPAQPGQVPGLSLQEGVGRIQLLSSDGRQILGIGSGSLSIHVLRPYSGWGEFRPRIEAALRAYADVVHSAEITRIGVRYINKIEISEPIVDLANYFRCGPVSSVEGLPERIEEFLSRVVYGYEDGAKLVLTLASVQNSPHKPTFVLDVDTFRPCSSAHIEFSHLMDIVDDLHRREGQAFESVITEATRSVFNAV